MSFCLSYSAISCILAAVSDCWSLRNVWKCSWNNSWFCRRGANCFLSTPSVTRYELLRLFMFLSSTCLIGSFARASPSYQCSPKRLFIVYLSCIFLLFEKWYSFYSLLLFFTSFYSGSGFVSMIFLLLNRPFCCWLGFLADCSPCSKADKCTTQWLKFWFLGSCERSCPVSWLMNCRRSVSCLWESWFLRKTMRKEDLSLILILSINECFNIFYRNDDILFVKAIIEASMIILVSALKTIFDTIKWAWCFEWSP